MPVHNPAQSGIIGQRTRVSPLQIVSRTVRGNEIRQHFVAEFARIWLVAEFARIQPIVCSRIRKNSAVSSVREITVAQKIVSATRKRGMNLDSDASGYDSIKVLRKL